MAIRSYEPSVDCHPRPQTTPDLAQCEEALSKMPARRHRENFIGIDAMPRPPRYIVLPKVFKSSCGSYPSPYTSSEEALSLTDEKHPISATGADRCSIGVSISSDTDFEKSSWINIWAAGVEINTLCVQHGMTGVVQQIGKLCSSGIIRAERGDVVKTVVLRSVVNTNLRVEKQYRQ